MTQITITVDDLLGLIELCRANDIDATCHRSAASELANQYPYSRFPSMYSETYDKEREATEKSVDLRYADLLLALRTSSADVLGPLREFLQRETHGVA